MQISHALLKDWALRLTLPAGEIANYCDHVEHNESADHSVIRSAGAELRDIALEIAEHVGSDPRTLYAERLAAIEQRNVLAQNGSYNGAKVARTARTWRELQLVQAEHDRVYHPDVVGMSKWDQLHHHTLHLVKLASATAAAATGSVPVEDWLARRVPDMLLFGVKLSTVSGEKLSDDQLPDMTLSRPEFVLVARPVSA
jgi:hypothetical protein